MGRTKTLPARLDHQQPYAQQLHARLELQDHLRGRPRRNRWFRQAIQHHREAEGVLRQHGQRAARDGLNALGTMFAHARATQVRISERIHALQAERLGSITSSEAAELHAAVLAAEAHTARPQRARMRAAADQLHVVEDILGGLRREWNWHGEAALRAEAERLQPWALG